MWAPLGCVLLLATAGAAHAQYTRINPSECTTEDAVDLVELVGALNDTVACGPAASCTFNTLDATDFSVAYYPGYKVVENNQAGTPYYSILYPCGTEAPDVADIEGIAADNTGVATFAIPLTAVGTDDSTAGWAIEYLGVADRVRYASAFATAPCLQKVAAPTDASFGGCGRLFVPPGNFAGDEPTPLANYDAQFLFGSYDAALKQIPFTASADPSPLGRAEHIVYMAAFFNKEADAARLLRAIVGDYRALEATATPRSPTIMWAQYSTSLFGFTFANGTAVTGPGYVFSYATYKTALVEAAGARLVPLDAVDAAATPGILRGADSPERGREIALSASVLGSEAALQKALDSVLKRVDILIDESFTTDTSLEAFLDTWGIRTPRRFPFLRNNALYRHDKAQTPAGADDWFGQAVIRPDVVLKDLRAAVDPCAFPGYDKVFFRSVSAGEAVTLTSGADCTGLTCDSYSTQVPLPIEGLIEEAEEDGGDLPGPDGGPAPPVGGVPTGDSTSCPVPASKPGKGKGRGKGKGKGNKHGRKKHHKKKGHKRHHGGEHH